MSEAFALALHRLDGVGRVTAARLLHHFDSLEALRRYPREQVLARIKGAPNAEALVARLFDDAVMQPLLARAAEEAAQLAARRVRLLTPAAPGWPAGVDALERGMRPTLLYAYGEAGLLSRPFVAFFGRPPLPPPAYEAAQRLAATLLAEGHPVATAAATGFDVALHKQAAPGRTPLLLFAGSGLARIPPALRPTAAQSVRHGGLLVSPFAMGHGPFAHDEKERALLMAALAAACVFAAPAPGTPEAAALDWAAGAGRAAFAYPGNLPLPPGAVLLAGAAPPTALLDALRPPAA